MSVCGCDEEFVFLCTVCVSCVCVYVFACVCVSWTVVCAGVVPVVMSSGTTPIPSHDVTLHVKPGMQEKEEVIKPGM